MSVSMSQWGKWPRSRSGFPRGVRWVKRKAPGKKNQGPTNSVKGSTSGSTCVFRKIHLESRNGIHSVCVCTLDSSTWVHQWEGRSSGKTIKQGHSFFVNPGSMDPCHSNGVLEVEGFFNRKVINPPICSLAAHLCCRVALVRCTH